MTTPSSQIAATDINIENGYASTQQMAWDDTATRTLAQKTTPQSQISLLDLQNKFRTVSLTYSAPKQNANLPVDFPGTPSAAKWEVTINPGVYIWSDSTASAALTTGGPYPSGLTIINNGYIIGKGGSGGIGNGVVGNAGGAAILIGSAGITITNNAGAYIAGGGGGGGSGWKNPGGGSTSGGGGGAGGGASGTGGAGGAIGVAGASGGGGRILPGTGGAGGVNGGGGGGGAGGGGGTSPFGIAAPGGTGGSANSVGGDAPGFRSTSSSPRSAGYGAGGGGGWGATGGSGIFGDVPVNNSRYIGGGTGGKAIALNGQTITQTNSGTIWGAVS